MEPLYAHGAVASVRPLFAPLDYGARREVAPGVAVRLLDAGHILGSATVVLEAEGKSVVFRGDRGPKGAPFLRDPVTPEHADLVFLESTHGEPDARAALARLLRQRHGVAATRPRRGAVVRL